MNAERPRLGAHVAGYAAAVLDHVLRRHLQPYLSSMRPEQRSEVVEAARGIREAAELWQHGPVSASGSASAAFGESVPLSGRVNVEARVVEARDMTVEHAADLLDVSPRRVRQLAVIWESSGLARKVGQSWVINSAAVETYREGQRSSA